MPDVPYGHDYPDQPWIDRDGTAMPPLYLIEDDGDDEEPPDVDDHHAGEYHDDADRDDHAEDDDATTWEPVDLGPWLRGEITQPQPSIGIHRCDGIQLIYPGREHAVLGETESGKTWFALGCVAAELALGHHVVYIHYEEGDPGSTMERLGLLGVDLAQITGRLRFVGPTRPVRTEWLEALFLKWRGFGLRRIRRLHEQPDNVTAENNCSAT
jgi:hypothetical protein